jgi:hypothetical protein
VVRLIPEADPNEIPLKPERDVARALIQTLPDDCVVYHSFPWLRPERNHRDQRMYLREGEADFVIVAPFGLLILEVKGGDIRYEASSRRWYRLLDSGLYKDIRDPFDQASGNMHSLIRIIREREFVGRDPLPFSFGFAVVFPDCRWDGTTPPGADRSVIFDADDMSQLGSKVISLTTLWSRAPNHMLDEVLIRQKVLKGLAGTFRLIPLLHRQLATQEERLVQLTDWQSAVLEGLYSNNRIVVSGPAGSGKTMLAVATVKHLSAQSKRVLFLCFNRSLAEWLREVLPAQSFPWLTVHTFNGLCADWCRRAHVPFAVPDSAVEQAAFFRTISAELLGQALDILTDRFDAVVVDEAQDFEPDWWLPIEWLNADNEDGSIFIFPDPKQNLFVNKQLFFPAGAFRYELPTNCRNTRRIARLCSRIRGVDIPSFQTAPEGIEPQVSIVADVARRAQAVEQQVRDWVRRGMLAPSQVAVLSPYRVGNPGCSLGRTSSLGSVSVTTDPRRWRDGDGVLVATVRSFKGLEADAVILADVGQPDDTRFTVSDLYVACSRAKHLLTIFATEPIDVLDNGAPVDFSA